MELDSDNELLQALSVGKQIDNEEWLDLFSRLIPRLERIAREEFPTSTPLRTSSSKLALQGTQETAASSEDASPPSTDKENAPPTSTSDDTLHPKILELLSSITSTMTALFSKYPPHTVQRLAELILYPKQHYRTLPAYLHALDRVVHVTSGIQEFPLPALTASSLSSSVLPNGTLTPGVDPLALSLATAPLTGLGSDESLGGALLTPIPWLTRGVNGTRSPLEGEVKTESTQMVDGPNGPGGVETVSVSMNGISSPRESKDLTDDPNSDAIFASLRAEGGVTQGELLRQEQRAGVVPAAQLQSHRGDTDGMGEEDEVPHARGPEKIGMEDMGPQGVSATQRGGPGLSMQGINVEAAIGRRLEDDAEVPEKEAEKESEDADTEDKDEIMADSVLSPGTAGEGQATPKREAEEEQGGDGKRVKEDVDVTSEDVEAEDKEEDTNVVMADADDSTAADEPKTADGSETKDAAPEAVDI